MSEDDGAIVIVMILLLASLGFASLFTLAWVCERIHKWWTNE